jgi:hypothetical protein
MRAPGFRNRDGSWTFTFNCWAFLRESGEALRVDELLRRIESIKVEELDL